MMKTVLLCALLAFSPARFEAGSAEDATSEIAESSETAESSEIATSSEESAADEGEELDWKAWIEKWVDPQVITTATTVIGFLAVIIKLAYELRKATKGNKATIQQIQELVIGEMDEKLPAEVSAEFKKYLPQLLDYAEKSNKVMNVFAKVLALSQEDTPESRLAILSLIQELGIISNEMIEAAKAEIVKQKEDAEAEEKAKEEAVQSVVEETSSYDGTSI